MKREDSTKYDRKKQRIAIGVMILICIPVMAIYISFLRLAFVSDTTGTLTLENFAFLYKEIQLSQATVPPIWPAFFNTVVFTLVVTVSEVAVSCLAGYALSRIEFKGKRAITSTLYIMRLFPGVLLLIGELYVLMTVKIVNTLPGVILVAIAFRLPASTLIIKNFFDAIPKDIENSTLVDGCTRLSGFYQVIIHMIKPGIASIATFSFLSAWSNYILFNTLIFSSKTPVLATYMRMLSRNDQMIASYGVFAAMALVYMAPVIIFFFIAQKQLMEGNISGGKGI